MKKLLLFISSFVYLLFGQTDRAYAQSDPFGSEALNTLSIATGGSKDIFEIITSIVNIVLYFLGGIAVLLGLYAGWLWFSSRGNTEQIKKAKGIMVSAVIGLAIIFASYAIVNFVIDTITEAIEPAPSGGGGGGGSTIEACAPPSTADTMVICGFSASKPVGGYVTISGWNFGPYVNPTTSKVTIGTTQADLVSCTATPYWKQRHTRDGSTYYQVKAIVPNIATGFYEIRVDNTVATIARFATKSGYAVSAETLGLNIACFAPDEGRAGTTTVVAEGINFGAAATADINMTGWSGTAAAQITIIPTIWTNTGATFVIPANALSSYVNISNSAVATGAPDSEFFKVTCADKADCTSQCCSSRGECRALIYCSSSSSVTTGPRINYITPDNGQKDNLITIQGSGFGSTSGTVNFTNLAGTLQAQLPSMINPACSNLWTDTEIIVAVPAVLSGSTYTVSVLPASATVPSNGVTFVANTTPRPGICSADRSTGSFGTPVAITGVNFTSATADTVKYGGFVGGSLDIDIVKDIATSTVPNLSRGLVGIQINSGLEVSNPYSFTVTEAIAGDPNIVNITPASGPAGTYLTINGTNFGNSKGASGNVLFGTISADFSFPLMCSGSVWTSSRILVKVPTGLTVATDYDIKVIRSDSKVSNTKPFTATSGTPGPGICAIFPDNGPKDTLVDFFGDNFGTTAGQVKFYNGKNATAVSWSNNSILDAPVPPGTETGPVVVTAGTVDSNAFNFRVGSCNNNNDCGSGQTCCKNTIGNYCSATSCTNTRMCTYGWSFKTVPTAPTPLEVVDHWPACDTACANSEIGVSFNVPMNKASAETTTNYSITDVTPMALRVITETYLDVVITSATLTENLGTDPKVVLDYAGNLQVNHTYQVDVFSGVQSLEGESTTYFWRFTVGLGSCEFTGVDINLKNYTASRPSQIINYNATPTTNAGSCGLQRLKCTSCTYDWTINTPAIATITAGANAQSMKATSFNGKVPPALVGANNVQCGITQGSTTVSASPSASLSYDYKAFLAGLFMTAHYPDCGNACLNSVVGLRFNSKLDANSVTNITNGTYIKIYDTADIATALSATVAVASNEIDEESEIEIDYTLVAGHTYRVVIVPGQIKNVYGNTFDAGFSWQFTVGAEECAVTSAVVRPETKTSTINKSIRYSVQTESDTLACGRIPVHCRACNYAWSSETPSVATISGSSKTAQASTVALGDTKINSKVIQTSGVFDATPGLLTVTAPLGPVYPIPFIEDYGPTVESIFQCRNTAVEIVFSEKMNTDSIKSNLKLFQIPVSGPRVQINGTYAFSLVDGDDADSANDQTKVVFSPSELLAATSNFSIDLGGGMVSIHNIPLNLNAPSPDLTPWNFSTGAEICSISFVRTEPSNDWFTCGGNSCENDDRPAVNGNQHIYSATAYSRYGTALSSLGMTYDWTVPSSQNIVTLTSDLVLGANQTLATAGENGQITASVTASLTITGINYGSASASLPVTVFLCEKPWPAMGSFPWVENMKNLNFSTYYCQQFTDTSSALPYLTYPPALSSNIAGNLGEYIFTVSINSATSKSNSMGTLAYYLPKSFDKKPALWERVTALRPIKQVHGQTVPATFRIPANINMAVNGNDVTVTWGVPSKGWGSTSDFRIQRKLSSDPDTAWIDKANYLVSGLTATSYVDSAVPNGRYDYQIEVCDSSSGFCSNTAPHTFEINVSASTETNFIIFRVMPNAGHLSVREWYKDKFPGEALGTMTTVDGYEAMKVGNTIYISAANISGSNIYTNIYIIAYSIGANAQTKDIYDQFVANFQLNTNPGFSNLNDDNLCQAVDTAGVRRSCSSNLDCESPTICRSKSLKLRRDVKRVTDLLPVQKYLATYGISHRACSHNGQISCTADSQCGVGNTCVNYYPQLNAGTFQIGKSNSKWPSWQATLATDLRQTLPVDPINKFTACPNTGADPETCWNEALRTFQCSDDSYVYAYLLEDLGRGYEIYSNFEYDPIAFGQTFTNHLYNGPAIPDGLRNLGNISTNLSGYCSAAYLPPGTNLCGNGQIDPAHCSNSLYANSIDCLTNGAVWVVAETCDGGISYGQCSASSLGVHSWWNEQVTGCNPPGTTGQCTWYVPTGLTAAMCGGYCGDDLLQTRYESCDISATGTILRNGVYHCPTGLDTFEIAPTCSNSCSMRCADGLPAAKCGDNVWTSGREACDTTGNPNGLADWDCTLGGNIMCGTPTNAKACQIYCDVGVPYRGSCGDRVVQNPELCEPSTYIKPVPNLSTATNSYTCSTNCDFIGQPYCGDTRLQIPYKEQCDTTPLTPILPINSKPANQYACRMTNDVVIDPLYTRCSLTTGGWCGDGTPQAVEQCDPLGYSVDSPSSSITRQYNCTTACQTNGGYCGNGALDTGKEECEGTAGLDGWGCTDGGTLSCGAVGAPNACKRTCFPGVPYAGRCGNNKPEPPEQCDGNPIACSVVDSRYISGDVACLTDNTCRTGSTAGCCTVNSVSAKFMSDNTFALFVNGVPIGQSATSGLQWETCSNGSTSTFGPPGVGDDGGVCEFEVNNTAIFDRANIENVLAFTATDHYALNGAAGVVGTFSCQQKYCKEVCYKGSKAGSICTTVAEKSACTSGGGTCISPDASRVGNQCIWNGDCFANPDARLNPRVSNCLPNDYGVTTIPESIDPNTLWRCKDSLPAPVAGDAEAWKKINYSMDSTWRKPTVSDHLPSTPPTNWWEPLMASNWKHMVPGATDIWLDLGAPSGSKTIYCRYSIKGSGLSIPVGDVTPPTLPTSLTCNVTSSRVLNWTASTDNVGVTGYKIQRSSSPILASFTDYGTATTNTYTDPNKDLTIEYYFRVGAQDGSGNFSGYSDPVKCVAAPVVNPPTNVVATGGDQQISLTWSAPAAPTVPTYYSLSRGTSAAGPFSYTAFGSIYTNSYTNISLPYDNTYCYQVTAYQSGLGTSVPSNTACATTGSDLRPSAPTLLTVTADIGAQFMRLTWAGSLGTLPGAVYVIQRATNALFTGATTLGTQVVNFFNDSGAGLLQNTRYYYRVFIDYVTGQTASVGDDELWPDQTPPGVPSNLTVTPRIVGGVSQIDVNFNLSTDDVTIDRDMQFFIERSQTASFATFITLGPTLDTCKNCWNDSAVTFGTEYFYRVYAQDQAGNRSVYSETKSAFPLFLGALAPKLNTVTRLVNGNREVVFEQPSGGSQLPTIFYIERQAGPTAPWVSAGSFTPAGSTLENTPYTWSGNTVLSPTGIDYNYRVRGNYGGTYTAYSNIISVFIPVATAPPTPTGLSLFEIARGDIGLTWNASIDPDGDVVTYDIMLDFGAGLFIVETNYSPTSYQRLGFTPGSTYSYRVRARDPGGLVSAWTAWATITLSL